MFAPFDTAPSFEVCVELLNLLNSNKIQLTNTAKTKSTRDGHGIMLGALIAKKSPAPGDGAPGSGTQDAAEDLVVLVTNSGIRYRLEGDLSSFGYTYVEPVVSAAKIDEALNKNDAKIHELTGRIQQLAGADNEDDAKLRDSLSKERSALCDESLKNVFALYKFTCADKKIRSLNEICTKSLPPTGTGDCCAPKLLNYAYSNNLTPLSMCEVYYSNGDDSSKNGQIVEPCDERCALILPHMLGLHILYRDNDIAVINKQSGLLSVPGRGPDKQDCVTSRLRRLYPSCIEQPSVHRLDMETSGLMVYALNAESQRNLRIQFEKNEIHKEYIALLDGVLPKKGISACGVKELFFRLDVDNRPHQIWDRENGKRAVTEWEILNIETYTAPDKSRRAATRVRFIPHTGRTHQLRLISADEHGFGCPIIGDSLYGKCEKGERLMLHASELSFTHPRTGRLMEFKLPAPF